MAIRYSLSAKVILLFFSAFVLRVFLAPFGTLELDFNTFRAWSQQLLNGAFGSFYNSWSDYLPGYLYILWLLEKITNEFPIFPQVLLYKLPAILADIGTGAIIFRVVSRHKSLPADKAGNLALLCAAFYLFNPAIIFNSTLWGQVDSLTVFFALAAVFYAQKWPTVSTAGLAIGALIKPQAAFIAPLLLFLWWRNFGLTKSLGYILFALLTFVLGFVPFAGEKQLLPFVFERLSTTANQYPYTSVNAFNFWALVGGNWQPDDTYKFLGIAIITVITAVLVYKLLTDFKNSNKYLLVACLFIITFIFLTRMHERHLLPALAPLVISAVEFPVLLIPYAILSVTYILNLQYSFVWITREFHQIFGQGIITLISAINLMCAGLIVWVFLRPKSFQLPIANFQSVASSKLRNFLTNWKLENGNWKIRYEIPKHFVNPLLIGIISFALISRLIGLWYPNTFYFDEVYHAWTAREMLRGNPAAWEWWNTPPEGFAYEWSHPPIAKLFMWGSMYLFGDNSFAWRLPGALLGTGTVLLVYLLAFQLIKSRTIGVFSAAIFALDGLPLVMSRIGMNDVYFLFFALLSVFLFLRQKYFFSSIFLGFTAASKWTALWILPVFFLAMFLFRTKPRFSIFWFLIITPLVYLASYIPFFLTGHDLGKFVELQQQMWWYHTGLRATHSYQSTALSWPLVLRPVWFFVEHPSTSSGLIANIYAMGNPLVSWVGLLAVGIVGVVGVAKRYVGFLFVALAWGIFFLPWAFSPRIMFYYHYLPAVPFLSLALGWYLSQQNKELIIITYSILLITYIIFFPHWTGIAIPKWLDEIYYVIPSWR